MGAGHGIGVSGGSCLSTAYRIMLRGTKPFHVIWKSGLLDDAVGRWGYCTFTFKPKLYHKREHFSIIELISYRVHIATKQEYVDGAGGLAICLELSGSARKEALYTVDHQWIIRRGKHSWTHRPD